MGKLIYSDEKLHKIAQVCIERDWITKNKITDILKSQKLKDKVINQVLFIIDNKISSLEPVQLVEKIKKLWWEKLLYVEALINHPKTKYEDLVKYLLMCYSYFPCPIKAEELLAKAIKKHPNVKLGDLKKLYKKAWYTSWSRVILAKAIIKHSRLRFSVLERLYKQADPLQKDKTLFWEALNKRSFSAEVWKILWEK